MNSWVHYQVYGSQVATEQSVKLGLLLAKRSRCFCNGMFKATCCSLRVAEAPQGKTIQQTPSTLLSWTTLAGSAKKLSCQFRQLEPSTHLQAL